MKISLLFYLLFLASCSQNRVQNNESKLLSTSNTYYLGMGYDKLLDKHLPSCITADKHTENQTLSQWKFSRVESWSTEKLKLGFASSFAYQTGIINADAKAQFTSDLYDSELTATYLLSSKFIAQTSFITNHNLNASSTQLLAAQGYKAFREKCGNTYVSAADKGGIFLAYIKFKFSDRNLKNDFNFNASYKGSMVNVDASIDALSRKQRQNSYAEINIYMEGGDLATFNETMADNFPIECKLDDWAKCKDMVKSIIRYSSSTFPADIAKGHTRNIHKTVTKYDMTEDKVDPVFAEREETFYPKKLRGKPFF